MDTLASRMEALFIEVCEMDMQSLKPGNVGLHGAAYGMCAEDFMRSAKVCAPAICYSHISLGERIFNAVESTRSVVDCNTNLGIILLCAPLVQSMFDSIDDTDFRQAVVNLLQGLTVDDAVLAYRAIRMAQPGGMGQVEEADLADSPQINLRDAMALARHRDMIAAQYANGYRLLFDEVVPCLLEFQAKWGYASWAVVGVYLMLLSRYPDSLVTRKHGVDEALRVSAEATLLSESFADVDKPEKFETQLLEFDHRLKHDGINPGTTADLVVAGLFIVGLKTLHQMKRKPLSGKDT